MSYPPMPRPPEERYRFKNTPQGWFDYVIGDYEQDEWAIWIVFVSGNRKVQFAMEGYYGDVCAKIKEQQSIGEHHFDPSITIERLPDIEIVSDKEWDDRDEEPQHPYYKPGDWIPSDGNSMRDEAMDLSHFETGDIITSLPTNTANNPSGYTNYKYIGKEVSERDSTQTYWRWNGRTWHRV
jgi:hypothetical protein